MMPIKDRDLLSVQEARDLVAAAKAAQKVLGAMGQAEVDTLVDAAARAAADSAERLAKMAHEETGFGKWRDKTLKNLFAAQTVTEAMRGLRTVGVLREDERRRLIEVAVPVGVIAGLIPSTNPTSTVIFKTLIALKAGNAIIFSPHPNARECIQETVRVLSEALAAAGAPKGLVSCMTVLTREGTSELMRHRDVALILATGGSEMVHAAYSSGTPAIGVGPGNTPAFIERTADVPTAVRRIIESKTFDYSTICASEQSVVADAPVERAVREEFARQGGRFLSPDEAARVASVIFNAAGKMNARLVGRSPQIIGEAAGVAVGPDVRVLLAEQSGVGRKFPFSQEKLCPVLAFYTEDGWENACERCLELLNYEGAGHTLAIHSQDERVVREFGLKKPVSRIIVNAGSSLGGVGGTTSLLPSLTLGCGAAGHNATSDNVGPLNLLNVRRVAWGLREIGELYPESLSPKGTGLDDPGMDALVGRIVDELAVRLGLD